MADKKTLLIINPISGTRERGGLERLVRESLSANSMEVEVIVTDRPGRASDEASRAVVEGYYSVIAAGGDGTVSEIASRLCGSQTAMGIIPAGSGNGLARSLNIPNDFAAAVKIIAQDNVIDVDHGMICDRPFFCTCGVGFDAAVSAKFATSKRRGRASYIKSAIREFIEYSPEAYGLSVGGKILTQRAFLIAVCNAPQYGNNAYIAPGADLTDGLLDITVIHSGSSLSTALVGVDLMTGNLGNNAQIDIFRVPTATITRIKPGPAHIDGDPVELGTRLDIACVPAALKVLAPDKEIRFRPFISPLRGFFEDLHYDIRANLAPLKK